MNASISDSAIDHFVRRCSGSWKERAWRVQKEGAMVERVGSNAVSWKLALLRTNELQNFISRHKLTQKLRYLGMNELNETGPG